MTDNEPEHSQTPLRHTSPPMLWSLKTQTLTFDRHPLVMAIVNVTPDSFSDGGRHFSTDLAVKHALGLVADGADILDIGGESTRPYSEPVPETEELNRIVPVIKAISKQTDTPISIDTSKATVARAAIAAGAQIINDVTGLQGDPEMVNVAIESGAGVCAMHMQGTPQTMQDDPNYKHVVEDIYTYLQHRKQALVSAGIAPSKVCLDPGIGFGKTHQHNIELLLHAERFLDLGCPILIGHSRKGFIGKLLAGPDASSSRELDRDAGTLAISLVMAQKGIHIIRVHEVAHTAQALKVLRGIT